ncbi:MAG: YggS family pyridoxal phosphate-dependent enzyme [Elusimicrobiota bacterium]|nr:YggS family pyridoxal phosphate-dependent enzyme [Endomicrobiia bacterium]MCX7910366.1 YggS family pyridoxal phosphate-dependent enzyme [Endomicrobiia bacterium]MDW8165563.1 YggS family pyridoxal phosphate-dependent enzyme [Elusimicrobiota bacterium]
MNVVERYLWLKKEVEKLNKEAIIVVVTKYLSDVSVISKLVEVGVVDFGENYAQKLEEKINLLNVSNNIIRWHFIGHLQRNKVKKVVPVCHLIQSLDSIELAQKINLEAQKQNKIQKCLIELKVSQEETKFGIKEEELYKTLDEILNLRLNNLEIEGIMTMAPYFEDPSFTRPYFKKAYNIFCSVKNTYKDKFKNFKILSMGMSNDYKIALEEGSNMIRIGSLLFEEKYKL